jgi:hypothetical protein
VIKPDGSTVGEGTSVVGKIEPVQRFVHVGDQHGREEDVVGAGKSDSADGEVPVESLNGRSKNLKGITESVGVSGQRDEESAQVVKTASVETETVGTERPLPESKKAVETESVKRVKKERPPPEMQRAQPANAVESGLGVSKPRTVTASQPFSASPQIQALQRRIEARVAEISSPKEKADALMALRTLAGDIERAPPGLVDVVAFRGWWDNMAAAIAKDSVVEESAAESESSSNEQHALDEKPEVSIPGTAGEDRESSTAGGSVSTEPSEISGPAQRAKGVLSEVGATPSAVEEPCASGGGYQDTGSAGTFGSEVGTSEWTVQDVHEGAATDGAPVGAHPERPRVQEPVAAGGPARDWAEPVAAEESASYPADRAPADDSQTDQQSGNPGGENGRAEEWGVRVPESATRPKIKVKRTVRKRKKVLIKPEPVKEEDGPDTITGEHIIFGAEYKDGTTEFSRRVQRDFEAEVAADSELRRIRAEIVLNGQEGRNDWEGLEVGRSPFCQFRSLICYAFFLEGYFFFVPSFFA